jgi:hypothetical protein
VAEATARQGRARAARWGRGDGEAEATMRRGRARAVRCSKGDNEARACTGGAVRRRRRRRRRCVRRAVCSGSDTRGEREGDDEASGGTWRSAAARSGSLTMSYSTPRALKRSKSRSMELTGEEAELTYPPFFLAPGSNRD